MKALITAFALLSFVAASTIPLAAQAQTQTTQPAKKSMKKKTAKKASHKKKTAKKMKKPSQA